MDVFLFSFEAIMPIVLMVAVGYLLKRLGLIDQGFRKKLNKIVFRAFLPILLFLNVYKIQNLSDISPTYIFYAVGATLVFMLISIPLAILFVKEKKQQGVTIQAIFRSNYALVGIALATSLFGEEGAIVATLLSAIIVPLYNVLAVIVLTIFSEKSISVKNILMDIVRNPLIIAILSGLLAILIRALFVKWNISFRISDFQGVYKALESLASVATPLALVALGAQFEFSEISAFKRPLIFGLIMRSIVVPVVGLGVAVLLGFEGAHIAAFIAVFATPTATSTVPMSQELDGDSALAGQFVIWTTIISAFVIFAASAFFKSIGMF